MLSQSAAILLAVAAPASAGATTRPQDSVTAFVDVSVIPMDREQLLTGQTVLVQGNRITAIGSTDQVKIPANAVRIDGQGKFLIPGLADMHAHVAPAGRVNRQLPDSVAEQVLFLYLANGVTTIRNMNGNPRHLVLRERAATGELLSPRIYTAGPDFYGEMNTDSIAARVAAQKAAGYDLVKILGISAEGLDTLVAAARRAGIPLAGHVPSQVGTERALRAPYASIEHLEGYVRHLLPPNDTLSRSLSPEATQTNLATLARMDESKIPVIAAATKRAGVWNCPTLVAFDYMVADTAVLKQRPAMRYVSENTLASWTMFLSLMSPAAPTLRRMNEPKRKLIRAFHDAGAGLLLGADGMSSFSVPGFSTHDELQALVAAGLTPYQALETGTRNVAVFLGTLDSTGTIATGKRADLVLLKGNPLIDIRHTTQSAGVMIGGRWLTRAEIDERLVAIEGQI